MFVRSVRLLGSMHGIVFSPTQGDQAVGGVTPTSQRSLTFPYEPYKGM